MAFYGPSGGRSDDRYGIHSEEVLVLPEGLEVLEGNEEETLWNFYIEHPEVTKRPEQDAEAWRRANEITIAGRGIPK
eukprot:gene58619-78202_t